MYSFILTWREFLLNLSEVESWIKSNAGSGYVGNSADTQLTLWYTVEPSEELKDAVQTYWDGLTEESAEAVSYLPTDTIRNAIDTLKAALVSKEWADMSTAERKIVLGITPTREELGL